MDTDIKRKETTPYATYAQFYNTMALEYGNFVICDCDSRQMTICTELSNPSPTNREIVLFPWAFIKEVKDRRYESFIVGKSAEDIEFKTKWLEKAPKIKDKYSIKDDPYIGYFIIIGAIVGFLGMLIYLALSS